MQDGKRVKTKGFGSSFGPPDIDEFRVFGEEGEQQSAKVDEPTKEQPDPSGGKPGIRNLRRRGIEGSDEEIVAGLEEEEQQFLPPEEQESSDDLGIGDFADKGHHRGNTE